MDTDDLMTIREAAQVLGVHPQTVRNALNEGRLPFRKALGRIVMTWGDVEAYRARTQPDGVKLKGRPRKAKE